MFKNISPLAIAIAFFAAWSLAIRPAHAYLDPGTGSYLFQIAIASLLGALFGLKMYWIQVKAFVAKLLGKSATSSPDQSAGKDAKK